MGYTDVVETSADSRFRAVLEVDEDCESPRDSQDHGTWFLADPRSDGLNSEAGGEDYHYTLELYSGDRNNEQKFARHLWLAEGRLCTRIDTDNTRGWIIEDDSRLAEVAQHNVQIDERISGLVSVSSELREWCEGDAYGVIIEQAYSFDDDGNGDDWNEVDSCWGFIGTDYAEEEARRMLAEAAGEDRAPRYGQLTFESIAEDEQSAVCTICLIPEYLRGPNWTVHPHTVAED